MRVNCNLCFVKNVEKYMWNWQSIATRKIQMQLLTIVPCFKQNNLTSHTYLGQRESESRYGQALLEIMGGGWFI